MAAGLDAKGPSGLDAKTLRRIFTWFKEVSANIAKTVAKINIYLATKKISEKTYRSVQRMQTNPLEQKPRYSIYGRMGSSPTHHSKCIIKRIENNLRFLVGNTQLCLGQKCGVEHAIHSLRSQYENPEKKLFPNRRRKRLQTCHLSVENIKKYCLT